MLSYFERLLLLWGCFVIFSASSFGTGTSQKLTGTVLDEAGAIIAKAFVLVHPDFAGIMRGDHRKTLTLATDKDGRFGAAVDPGFYDVCVMASAFKAECRKIHVIRNRSQNIQFDLKVSPEVTAVLGDKFEPG